MLLIDSSDGGLRIFRTRPGDNGSVQYYYQGDWILKELGSKAEPALVLTLDEATELASLLSGDWISKR